ncbi:hypothetical protein F4604DRAFT_1912683 [Suillus subluteus]|nr:hypothetical protein F4604DRAFT_1912683 [Suillus subluteus]
METYSLSLFDIDAFVSVPTKHQMALRPIITISLQEIAAQNNQFINARNIADDNVDN